MAGANPLRHLVPRAGERRAVRIAVDTALASCGLSDVAHVPVETLSLGQRRLVELARCLAGPYRILLLDEPSSGLDRAESDEFGRILRRVVGEQGIGALLVEHDMALVLEVCDDIYVLDFGRHVFHGSPAEVTASPVVQAAYLGAVDADVGVPDPIP
jgi:ABC-type branched-subunit amino acid transport system ATPase component